jgi:DNA-directed RNA polymerase specialized sigma24 family protein
MSEGNSVSGWLNGLKVGHGDDIQRVWDRYFQRLVKLVDARLPGHARRAFDEEDVALSAFRSFCERASRGQFAQLADRDDLWRLLSTIAKRKLIGAVRRQTRAKRGGGHVLGESVWADGEHAIAEGLAPILSREPTPEAATQFADECDRLFARLGDSALRSIAVRRLEGHTCEEIASELAVSTRTVDRKLRLIRSIWEKAISA